ncbi:hypothetical protein GH714_023343 [Hevea brasiliensis]|uniref:Sec23/Sec24 trunk domain-containing protein n=1 Tax=Hevea brasiliensis TaxID=3981 RepID=A0A6A6LTF5_HEVBR|nr:hypothetical protein GH714_023343 [Hevea brasiliensis]
MGTENPGRPNFPLAASTTPFAAPPPTMTPFSSSGPMVGLEASGFRATPPAVPQTTIPSTLSGPAGGSQTPDFRPAPPASYVPSAVGPFQRFPTPQYPTTPQTQTPSAGAPPIGQPSFQPPGQVSSPLLYRPQPPQMPSVPMGSPPPSNVNVPQSSSDSSFFTARPNFQPSFPPADPSYPPSRATLQPPLPGYIKQLAAVSQAPPMQSPFQAQQGSYVPPPPTQSSPFPSHQGGFGQPPPVAASFGLHSREQIQQPGSVPPIGGIQGLLEDFSSLSIGSMPGSIDPGLDPKALPRPLDGDVEPTPLPEAYSMNCDPRYLRLTTSAIPNSQSLVSRWHLPLGAVVCPLAEAPDGEEVPILNFVSTGIIRCRRCRTMFVRVESEGKKERKENNEIFSVLQDEVKWKEKKLSGKFPGEYFAHLDATGRRVDLDQRPELTKGSVEFVAPTEYMVRPPMPPLYFFLIDVSISAVRSGMIESSLVQPQMMVVSDLDDIFVPLPDDLLVNLSESRSVVEAFLDSLPSMFQDNMNVESAFGPALKAAFMVMSQLGGKLLIFQNTMPSIGFGRLKLRGDDLRVYGTDKEHALRIPEDPFYKQMAADFTKYQIGVNVYAFSDKYTDLASIGTLAKYTGGQVYYYPSFQSANHGEKLRHELARDLTRETAWEAVMRIRCGKGIRFTSYHGNFMLRSTDLLALPAVDCDKAYAMQLSLEETLLTTQTVYFQVALLYTASCGERRIRVHTAAAPVVADLGEMYRQADTGAIVSLFCRLAIEKTLSHKLEDARNSVQLRIVKALREYRNLYAVQHRLGGRMIYPDSLKFLPLYGLALRKSTPLRGGYADVQLDERCAAGFTMMALPVKKMMKLLYPSLIRVDDHLLKPLAKADEFKNITRMLSPDIAMTLLGPDAAAELSKVALSERDTEMSRKLMEILKKLRESDRSYYQLCYLVRQGEQPREGFLVLTNLVEDAIGGTNGYVDWMLLIHRQVQQNA